MARALIPYGLLANGNYGILLDPANQNPLATAIEVLTALPSVASADNFDGRIVFDTSTTVLSIFASTPTPNWKPLEGIPATVGSAAGSPPTVPTPASGSLYWDLTTEVLYVWNGSSWVAAGGKYAAQIVENIYIGNGTTTNYPTGSSKVIASQYVEIFMDGVRQSATTDYNVVGTNIVFVAAPASGVKIYVRSMVSDSVVQNSQVATAKSTAVVGQTNFTTGQAGSDPAGIFVYVNGILQSNGGTYTLTQQDTSIASLTKSSTTVAVVTTNAAHGASVGASVTLSGFAEAAYNNQTFTISATPTPTTFEIPVATTDPVAGTGNPTMFFSPPFINDVVVFSTPMVGGEIVDIRSLKNVVVSGAVGEINTLGSVGSGTPLNASKAGATLQVKSLVAGANVSLTDTGNEVQIAASTGQGFEDRIGINAASYTVVNTVSYVGVRNTSLPVTIDLTGITASTTNSGRKVTIKDESGGAGTNQIQIVAGSALIDGVAAPKIINTNYGSVTLVMDGSNWYVTAVV